MMSSVNRLGVVAYMGMTSDTVQKFPLGTRIEIDDDFYGSLTLEYGLAGSSLTKFHMCVMTADFSGSQLRFRPVWDKVPNTANLGKTLGVVMQSMVNGEYGWFCTEGVLPVISAASVAADTAIGIGGVGQVGAIANGKQIMNARCVRPATGTFTRTIWSGRVGSPQIQMQNTDGFFPGCFVSGTGVPAAAYVTDVSRDQQTITISANLTAAPAGTLTATPNNGTIFYNFVQFQGPFAQGQIV